MKCANCLRVLLVRRRIETDKKTGKQWVIDYCMSCKAPNDIEEYNPVLHKYITLLYGSADGTRA